jgi:hypothetical protein
VEESAAVPASFATPDSCCLPLLGADSLDVVAALRYLFPGHFYPTHPKGRDNVAVWTYPQGRRWPMLHFTMDEGVRSLNFPYEGATFRTTYAERLLFKRLGRRFQAVFFSTNNQEYWLGRGSLGVLGISIWEERNGCWGLVSFNPGVVANGAFATASLPDSGVQVNDSTVVLWAKMPHVGAAGVGQFLHHLLIYQVLPRPRLIFYDRDISCKVPDERMTHWDTEARWLPGNRQFPDLELTTRGHFDPDNDWYDWGKRFNPWWAGVERRFKKVEQAEFEVRRWFRFNGVRYVRR